MNAKHYVSLEVAKLLKEKGYNEECYLYYKKEDPALYYRELYNRNSERDDIISCPSLLEAMDWLEERGMHVEIRMPQLKVLTTSYKDKYKYEYYFVIYSDDTDIFPISEYSDGSYYLTYPDRYECMNAAIMKGVELL